MIVGLRKTGDVLVAACTRDLYAVPSARGRALWNHALAVGIATEQLAEATRRADPATAFLPGLFHDVGRLAFLLADAQSSEAIEDIVSVEGDRCRTEREWYGFDHTEASASVAALWGLDDELCDAVRWHHRPAEAGPSGPLAELICAADALAYIVDLGVGAPPPVPVCLADLGISPDDAKIYAARLLEAFTHQTRLLG
jgi:HD-like signal output (HDOD) protein